MPDNFPTLPLDSTLLGAIRRAVDARMSEPTVELPVRTAEALIRCADLLRGLAGLSRSFYEDADRNRYRYSSTGEAWWDKFRQAIREAQTHLNAPLQGQQDACDAVNLAYHHIRRGEVCQFNYVNHRGEAATRQVVPLHLWWGVHAWPGKDGPPDHAEWLLHAWDVDRQAERDFPLARIGVVDGRPALPPDLGLHRVFARVLRAWDFRQGYPLQPAGQAAAPERLNFRAAHAIQHLAKQTGKLAGLFEPLAHGAAAPDPHLVSRQVAHTIVDALQLLHLAGGTPEMVEAALAAWEAEHAAPQ